MGNNLANSNNDETYSPASSINSLEKVAIAVLSSLKKDHGTPSVKTSASLFRKSYVCETHREKHQKCPPDL